jgi:hypothetical protein
MIGHTSVFLDRRVVVMLACAWPALVWGQALAPDGPKTPAPQPVQYQELATPIWTDHLKLTAHPIDVVVAPGDRTTLVIDIEPGEGMHVYAPGAESYQIVALTVAAQPFVRVLPIQYPPSEIYVFAPLNERIPAYQKPFTLRRDLLVEAQPPAQAAFRGKASLIVTGTLDYQACDDRVCFNPVSVPLSWTLPLGSPAAPAAAPPAGRR